MRIPVSKYHGCGNDFVIASMNDLQGIDLSHLAAAVCDRHTGIGADGFIAVKEQPLEMIFIIRMEAGRRCAATAFAVSLLIVRISRS